jgi:hypothetical protein
MKTIKSLHFAKYAVLLFIAIFGLFIGGTQNPPRPLKATEIGGGGSETRKLLPSDIGGQGGVETRKFAYSPTEIGGNQTVPHPAMQMGTPGTSTKKLVHPLASADIGGFGGGQPMPRIMACGNLVSAIIEIPIGGSQGAPRQLKGKPKTTLALCNVSIGGNGKSTAPRNIFIVGSSETGYIEYPIGGQGSPRHLLDIGDTNGAERRNLVIGGPHGSPRPVRDIGGKQNPPRTYTEIGGGQTAPREMTSPIGGLQEMRKIADIGGQQTAPRTFFGEIGGNSCPRC